MFGRFRLCPTHTHEELHEELMANGRGAKQRETFKGKGIGKRKWDGSRERSWKSEEAESIKKEAVMKWNEKQERKAGTRAGKTRMEVCGGIK